MRVCRSLRGGCLIALVGAACGVAANTQVFRCTDAEGHTVYSDTGCGSSTQPEKVDVAQSSGGLSQIKSTGLTAQEQNSLGKIKAAEAAQQQGAQGGGAPASGTSSSSAPSPTPIHSSY